MCRTLIVLHVLTTSNSALPTRRCNRACTDSPTRAAPAPAGASSTHFLSIYIPFPIALHHRPRSTLLLLAASAQARCSPSPSSHVVRPRVHCRTRRPHPHPHPRPSRVHLAPGTRCRFARTRRELGARADPVCTMQLRLLQCADARAESCAALIPVRAIHADSALL
ncbi:hypothetical protein C8F04DRAFT_1269987 [Mycena alexandri]|uniref:Uncharacterized protein n=1 Tax=Mycena alexandri TaxID=1745969 RepID=A0AAD6SBD2_9AGAR|nr:hypothetical protein C8F04DRAFT_1269987 [Mycena alexandri]